MKSEIFLWAFMFVNIVHSFYNSRRMSFHENIMENLAKSNIKLADLLLEMDKKND